MSFLEVLQRVTTALDHAGIAYMLTGSFASVYYGSPRSTQDIDLVIAANPTQLREFTVSLPGGEYYVDLDAALEAHKGESLFNVIDLKTGWKIDMIIRKARPFSQEEFGRRQLLSMKGVAGRSEKVSEAANRLPPLPHLPYLCSINIQAFIRT